ncbi:HWE histidine kinase domain-containing protein [Dankookia sp. GCM10030260]|uniref:HWE histidine kinase domain-containing protein n=1 Tax=Dankookia sp. GCM10030260 TaxID=3273390 RepID=UPI0036141987
MAMLIPAFGVGTAVAKRAVAAYQEAFQAGMVSTAQALALAMDREIGAYRATMATLAGSSALDGLVPDLDAFEVEARRASAALSTSVTLLDGGSLRQIINTALPPGAPAGRISAADFRAVAATGKPLVTDLVIGAVAQRPVVGVAVPVERAGQVRFVLAARLQPERIARLLEGQSSRGMGFDVLVDSSQRVVARSREHEAYVGRQAPEWFTTSTAGRAAGFLEGISVSGQAVVLGFARLGTVPGWVIGSVELRSNYVASWRRPLEMLALGGGLLVLLGTMLAVWLSRRLIQPVTALVRAVQALGTTGATTPRLFPPASGVAEFEALRRGLIAADDALRARDLAKQQADERQALLMREVDHRAKNALAVALSLAQLAPRAVPPDQFATVLVGRIAAMARAHSLLSKAAWSGGDVKAIAEGELAPYAERVVLAGPAANLVAEAVQPMAMLLHELATNAAKHGALSRPEGRVRLVWGFAAAGDGLRFTWAESGGPTLADEPQTFSFGSRLITQLVERQLGGTIEFDWQAGGLQVGFTLPPGKVSRGLELPPQASQHAVQYGIADGA